MFKIPNLEKRKQHTTTIIETYKRIIETLTNNKKIQIYITYFIHTILVFIPFIILISKPVNVYFYISLIIWILIMCLHLYFNGCIFIRIERELMEDNSWIGIWTYVFYILHYFRVELTPPLLNFIFIVGVTIMTCIIVLKLISHFEPYIIITILKWIGYFFLQKHIEIHQL